MKIQSHRGDSNGTTGQENVKIAKRKESVGISSVVLENVKCPGEP